MTSATSLTPTPATQSGQTEKRTCEVVPHLTNGLYLCQHFHFPPLSSEVSLQTVAVRTNVSGSRVFYNLKILAAQMYKGLHIVSKTKQSRVCVFEMSSI